MKLILMQYLASLKERGELDAVLPDLLSQLGLNVYSRPGRGTRQDGVDVGAVGRLDEGQEKVYLFSIKPGNLTRRDWNSDSPQSLRPSLDQILDAYIPNRLPVEHRGKNIVICIAIGGDVQEQVQPDLTGYFSRQQKHEGVSFEVWNGDKLASYIQSSFLREDLLPDEARSSLRKSLAMLDDPEISSRHFSSLIQKLTIKEAASSGEHLTAIRQIGICLWILFAWSRDANNLESAYHAGESTLLHAWNIARKYIGEKNKTARAIEETFFSIFGTYREICAAFLNMNVLPYTEKLHAISFAIRGSSKLDINLKLFDLLGRLSLDGIWAYWRASQIPDSEQKLKQECIQQTLMLAESVKALISNNPALLLPIKDDQAIDILIATLFLATNFHNQQFIQSWMSEMLTRAQFAYKVNGDYPCVLDSYNELLEHPKFSDVDYKQRATSASVLYPTIGLWSSLINDNDTYNKVGDMKRDILPHCTFQFWYPDEDSETHFYLNSGNHGAALTDLAINDTKENFLKQLFDECEISTHFKDLSAVKAGLWPLIAVACRCYRLPLPLHLFMGVRRSEEENTDSEIA